MILVYKYKFRKAWKKLIFKNKKGSIPPHSKFISPHLFFFRWIYKLEVNFEPFWLTCFVCGSAGWVTRVHRMCNVAQSFTLTLSCAQTPRERRRAKCALLSPQSSVIHSHHHPRAHWDKQWQLRQEKREEREGSSVSMWTSSGYPLGRASVKLVFIENCQMVICKYLCKKFWKLCNSIYRNIVKSLLHITYISFHF